MASTLSVRPPTELVELLKERRVIPFIGAGFSRSLGLPTWEELLEKVADKTDDCLPFADLMRHTQRDLLQVAEYLYLKSYSRIGPLRHVIEQAMSPTPSPVVSAAHVELANLGAQQIYTTNYDDLLEETYRRLGLAFSVVTLPRDVAASQGDATQIVKYHGDLRHDETLVLTESSYYRRLDFESPMDLKFRSDILGRSVLFVGYSFRDLNIRIIWFKLMAMMRDIPQQDRRPSFIVRLEPNPVLEELDRAVGLQTITLDPNGEAETAEDREDLLASFLNRLASRAGTSIPGSSRPQFVSSYLLNRVKAELAHSPRTRSFFHPPEFAPTVRAFLYRELPAELAESFRPSYNDLLTAATDLPLSANHVERLVAYSKIFGISPPFAKFVLDSLRRDRSRQPLLRNVHLPWPDIWNQHLDETQVQSVIAALQEELDYTSHNKPDHDLAYAADAVKRLLSGQLISSPLTGEVRDNAEQAYSLAVDLYPSLKTYVPAVDGPPGLADVLREIDDRIAEYDSEHSSDGVPDGNVSAYDFRGFDDEDDPF